jgi:hypothetical protein
VVKNKVKQTGQTSKTEKLLDSPGSGRKSRNSQEERPEGDLENCPNNLEETDEERASHQVEIRHPQNDEEEPQR